LDQGAEHVHALLSDYLDGELTEAQRAAIDEHLATCPSCRSDLASLRLTVQIVRQLPVQPVSRTFALPVRPRPTPILTWLRWTTGALAALFVLLLVAPFVLPNLAPSREVAPGAPAITVASRGAPAPATDQRVAVPTTAPAPPAGAPTAFAAAPAPPAAAAATPTSAAAASAPPAAAPAANASTAAQSRPASGAAPPAPTPRAPSSGSGPAQSKAIALAPTATAYPAPAVAPPAPNPAAQTPATAYPVATAPAAPPPTASGAYPATTVAPAAPTAAPTSYPAPETSGAPLPVAAGPTTWYTPALLVVGILVVISALALVLLGRRH
jgi:Putative zinc-finger